jgi:lipopolysaccharide/colanic/teichoic acid biosynthesis glycosyltransferase
MFLKIIFWIVAIAAVVGAIAAVLDITKNKVNGIYARCIKRFLDAFLSTGAIIILSPLFLVLTAVCAYKMKGNPFFTQARPGWHEKIFKLIKFRTMSNEKDKDGNLLPDEKRINAYGKFLRYTSLDELPELFNILVGQMSIIGPRPLLVKYLPYYTEREKLRHLVRPGITGLAQVNGRNALDWDKRLELDAYYVENISFMLDFKIFIMTIVKLIIIKQNNDTTKQIKKSLLYFPIQCPIQKQCLSYPK